MSGRTNSQGIEAICVKLERIHEDLKETKADIKLLTENTIRQDERIKRIEFQFTNEGKIYKLERRVENNNKALTNLKITIAGWGAGAAGVVYGGVEIVKMLMDGGLR